MHWLPTWKLSPSTTKSEIEGRLNQVTASLGSQPNLEDSSTTEPVLGTRRRSTTPACGAYRLIFFNSFEVVESDQRLVLIQRLQGFARLGGIGVNDLVPDEILLLPGRAGP